jgi:hypothetical protein
MAAKRISAHFRSHFWLVFGGQFLEYKGRAASFYLAYFTITGTNKVA